MQTISTKYLQATNTKGARIKATTSSGISVNVPYMYECSQSDNHWAACNWLMEKLEWHGQEMIQGSTKDGYVFVFANDTKRV